MRVGEEGTTQGRVGNSAEKDVRNMQGKKGGEAAVARPTVGRLDGLQDTSSVLLLGTAARWLGLGACCCWPGPAWPACLPACLPACCQPANPAPTSASMQGCVGTFFWSTITTGT